MPAALPSDGALAKAAASIGGAGALAGFRLNGAPRQTGRILVDGQPVEVTIRAGGAVLTAAPVARTLITQHGRSWQVTPWRAASGGAAAGGDGAILAPMPGRIIAVAVARGDKVTKGQKLVTLEAMKMEHGLIAPFNGTVEDMPHAQGAQVQEGALLVRIVAEEAE